ncbi:hypothetical protein HanHA300_Chr10g0351531 [Helianthus annuus]|nr:hypothetical protein HanHA300_Chr10g0351531 [Helianthus annuus]KAJ0529029.1 hypothetical protein HanHA89_Chr10g0373121 [Helianthus annuus]KAJ0695947.1 hypothetical protein HanLR1_Chr10g0351371 [Helianthus annuus]
MRHYPTLFLRTWWTNQNSRGSNNSTPRGHRNTNRHRRSSSPRGHNFPPGNLHPSWFLCLCNRNNAPPVGVRLRHVSTWIRRYGGKQELFKMDSQHIRLLLPNNTIRGPQSSVSGGINEIK